MLRKSAVAMKPKSTIPKKQKMVIITEMFASERWGIRRSPKSKRSKTTQSQKARAIIEPSKDSDSEDNRALDTIPLRLSVKISAREEGVAAGRGSSAAITHDKREHRERKTRAKRAKENTTRLPLVSRECLSNSIQEEGESETHSESLGTQKSTRRQKPVDKMVGVMIESITKENPRVGETPKNPMEGGN